MAKMISDNKLLEMLLIHGGVRGAADACGLSQNAIYKRLQGTTFRTRYNMLQGVILSNVTMALTSALDKAVKSLVTVIDDPNVSPGIKVNAANALLNHTNRYIESANILRRLDALEQLAVSDSDAI